MSDKTRPSQRQGEDAKHQVTVLERPSHAMPQNAASESGPNAGTNYGPKFPPDDLPIYRLLSGPDDASFCQRVSEAIALGYALHGSPCMTHDGSRTIVAQALIWPTRR